jgi:NADH:ubiquinone oxidoreductase subunit 6 (subunit J)
MIDLLKDPFTYFAVLSVLFSIMVVSMQNLLRASVMLGAVFCSISGLYFLLDAPFVAVMQVLLYISVVVGLMLFVIMLIKKDVSNRMVREKQNAWRQWTPILLSLFVVILVLLMIGIFSLSELEFSPMQSLPLGTAQIQAIGQAYLTDFVLPFELISLLLFVAAIGAIILARKKDTVAEYQPRFEKEED